MKTINILLLSLLIAGLTSCQKEATVKPKLTVTYQVMCKACLIYFEDNQWNRTNHTPGRSDNVSQHINVYGQWTNTFEVSSIDTASLRLYTGSFAPDQTVHAIIRTNDGKVSDKTLTMGVDNQDVYFQLAIK